MIELVNGVARWLSDYEPYPHQEAFHLSPCRFRLLGGAAGPGKTYALLQDHLEACQMFNDDEGKEVHTLILRRTYPKLAATVITRFREKIPKELYRDFNESKGVVTWHNGSTTQFGAMQYEHDVWGYQGQWYKIGYDELTEFTFSQWANIAAWNRCPVSARATREGATNPIGIGAAWVEDLFVKHRPCAEMDDNQKALYNPKSYGYFPATYKDNPIYANDQAYITNLDSYQSAISRALKMGEWGIGGTYFDGAWDDAYNVYEADSLEIKPWWKRWIGGDWGFDHNSAIHWLCMDDAGIVRVYRELIVNRRTPEELGELIAKLSKEPEGKRETIDRMAFSHDAFNETDSTHTRASRLGAVLIAEGLPYPQRSTKDKLGREQILYDYLKGRIAIGQTTNPITGAPEPKLAARLQISKDCPELIRTIGKAPRDEKNRETIAEFLGDDPLQSVGYALYAMFGKPRDKPADMAIREAAAKIEDPLVRWNYLRTHLKQTGNPNRVHQTVKMPWELGR